MSMINGRKVPETDGSEIGCAQPSDNLRRLRTLQLLASGAAAALEAGQILKIAQTLIEGQERLLMIGKRACSAKAKPACGQLFCQSGQVLLSKDKWLDAPQGFEP